jgi:hypothetical protein
VFDYAPKRVREQWNRDEAHDAAGPEFADDPPTGGDNDAAPTEPRGDADERISSLVPRGAHEDGDDDAGDADHRLAQDWEHDDPEHEPDEPPDRRTEDWLDELEYRAELRERRAKAAEMDREYEDQLERLAASLRTLRDEDESEEESEPDRPSLGEARRARSQHSPDERDHYIDGVRLPRFLQSSYVPPPAREGGGWLGIVLSLAIACGVGVPLSYYFYAVANPFASKPGESLTKSDVQYAIASTSNPLPKMEERVPDAGAPNAGPPANVPAEAAPQAAPAPSAAPQPPAAQPEPSQSLQAPRRVPLTHVVRWPDQAQDTAAPQPPHAAASVGSAWPAARSAPPPAPVPNAAETSLAYAPALAPAPAQPAAPRPAPTRAAPPRPPAGDADEVQLMLKQGQEFVAAGDLATARVVLRRAAQAGAAAAAFALAQTYDPMVLAKMRTRGVDPDAAEARRWYEMAQKLGSGEAARQLERLARDE